MPNFRNMTIEEISNYLKCSNTDCKVSVNYSGRRKVVMVLSDHTKVESDWYEASETDKSMRDKHQILMLAREYGEADVYHKVKVISEQDNETVYVSLHAIQRAKERLGWNQKTLLRMTKKVVLDGILYKDMDNQTKRVVQKRFQSRRGHTNCCEEDIRMYGNVVFLFSSGTLLTIIPTDFLVFKQFNDEDLRAVDRLSYNGLKSGTTSKKRKKIYVDQYNELTYHKNRTKQKHAKGKNV